MESCKGVGPLQECTFVWPLRERDYRFCLAAQADGALGQSMVIGFARLSVVPALNVPSCRYRGASKRAGTLVGAIVRARWIEIYNMRQGQFTLYLLRRLRELR